MINFFDTGKYADVFGFGEPEEKANAKINEMLDMVEKLYNKGSMPEIMQIMVYSRECGHCRDSLPLWKNLVIAIAKRLKKYSVVTLNESGIDLLPEEIDVPNAIEMGSEIDLGDGKMSGMDLLKTFKVNSIPFFLQNFTVDTVIKRGNLTIKNLKPSNFYVVSVGELQPFGFLATAFDIPNLFIEWKYSGSRSQ